MAAIRFGLWRSKEIERSLATAPCLLKNCTAVKIRVDKDVGASQGWRSQEGQDTELKGAWRLDMARREEPR